GRGLVVREDVELELADPGAARPLFGLLHQCRPRAPSPEVTGHHETDVRHVLASGVKAARSGKTADDRPVLLGHQHGRMRVAANRAEVAALLCGAAPLASGDQPAFVFGTDCAGQLYETRGVAGLGVTDSQSTITPAPPRRGSPAAS